jgi:hypothetical protein
MSARLLLAALAALVLPSGALAHLERPTTFPDPAAGSVPAYRTTGPSVVVCKPDSRRRILRLTPTVRARNLAWFRRCRYRHIQAAVNAVRDGTRILVLPGVYREEPSRRRPANDPACESLLVPAAGSIQLVPSFEYQRRCPNAQNLIAIVGKRQIQLEGTGTRPADVLIEGDRRKLNVIRADRADGVVLRNFTVQYSDFNNVYVLETNGFRLERIVSRWSREYGFLTFTADHGLYDRVVAYGSGDAGVYPGSGPEGHCLRYGIEIRNVDSYGNTLGYSGTAGNGIWVHDSRFHDNATGVVTDSIYGGHPGMPQDCAKWERNRINSNNLDLYGPERDAYCRRPVLSRDPKVVCPTNLVPLGTGLLIAGGNDNLVAENWIYDNWRYGAMLFWVPAFIRGESDPAKNFDTSNGNRFVGNRMGVRPDGRRAPNGLDFWWDEEGRGNCWQGNTGATSDPGVLPACPEGSPFSPGVAAKQGELLACSTWNPVTNSAPPGCSWPTRPPRPRP